MAFCKTPQGLPQLELRHVHLETNYPEDTHSGCSLLWTGTSIWGATFTMGSLINEERGSSGFGKGARANRESAPFPYSRHPPLVRRPGSRCPTPITILQYTVHTRDTVENIFGKPRKFHAEFYASVKTTWEHDMEEARQSSRNAEVGEFMCTWLPHHRLNAGIIGVGKQVYYQAGSHGLSRSCRLPTAPIPIYILTTAPSDF